MDHPDLPATSSPEFRRVHAAVGDLVRQAFPKAEPSGEYGMAGWRAEIQDPPPEDSWKGTMPRTHLTVAPVERKAGVTIHIWHPNEPYLLKDNEAWLTEAGFKVMVGCLQWNRKAAFPLDALERLLAEAVRK